jgi:hypothetical protein
MHLNLNWHRACDYWDIDPLQLASRLRLSPRVTDDIERGRRVAASKQANYFSAVGVDGFSINHSDASPDSLVIVGHLPVIT